MYFCTPTFDPFDGLAKTLQVAYAPAAAAHDRAKTIAGAGLPPCTTARTETLAGG